MIARPHSSSQSTRGSNHSNRLLTATAPAPSLTPSIDRRFTACAATASFFLYSQHNVILCLHHDTLEIERRFERHRQPVEWIAVDNVSERANGQLVVSYDSSQTTIIWDLLTGNEVARFCSFEEIRVATWMRNANIAFGKLGSSAITALVPWLIPLNRKFAGDSHTLRTTNCQIYLFCAHHFRSHHCLGPWSRLQNIRYRVCIFFKEPR